MSTLDDAIQKHLRNIEQRTGRSLAELSALVNAAGIDRHSEIIAFLKAELGMSHGDANAIAKVVRESQATAPADDPAAAWYIGPKAALRPLHDRILAEVARFGTDIEQAPKKGYVSLRRKKQFAQVGPATNTQVEVALILRGEAPVSARLVAFPAGAMCTHRVRLGSTEVVDAELIGWLRAAYNAAG